jgi:hypothetical protein
MDAVIEQYAGFLKNFKITRLSIARPKSFSTRHGFPSKILILDSRKFTKIKPSNGMTSELSCKIHDHTPNRQRFF